ncbi:glycoside hydrolase family 55 protein [Halosquirtibacter xylanolyticus]|uniref:glycosyl hydrolase family 28-related protein n=1 Tax=Halosquirtibacter xylanolyticus TaxID=3374599 RepID=UPI003747FC87|nr:glycoside hydrolase family 55 protein [Prolixibacteraceae bacterium]
MKRSFTLMFAITLLWSCQNTQKKSCCKSKESLPYFGKAGKRSKTTNTDLKTFNVTEYGAIPNDQTDDTDAIQATIDAASQAEGGIVLIPKGKYIVLSDKSQKVIEINHSNIHIQGQGEGKDGTIIMSMNPRTQPNDQSPWLSPSVFHTGLQIHDTYSFYNIKDQEGKIKVTKDARKGADKLSIESTNGIHAGDVVLIGMQNQKDQPSLMKKLMNDMKFEKFQTSYSEAKQKEEWSYQWFTEVKEVINDHEIMLTHKLRHDIETKYNASAVKMAMLNNISFTNLRFESQWEGGYVHHKTREFDYGWSAIGMNRVIDGMVKNITIDNYTQGVQLVNSTNTTVQDITITGIPGHYSIKLYHSNDNLFQRIHVLAKRTHGPSVEGASQGNVFTEFDFSTPQPLDFHGIGGVGLMPPMNNLMENMTNVSAIAGGAAPQNTPHAGPGNTFYNIEMTGNKHGAFHEVFHSWIYQNPKKFKIEKRDDCHIQYIGSNIIGVYNEQKNLTVNQKTNNISSKEVIVKELNSKPATPSLYHTQKEAGCKSNCGSK